MRDVTERVRMEEKLRDSEAKIRAIVDTAVDGIITIDEDGLIESFNRGAERIFGYAVTEVLGRNVGILMPAPYRDEHDQYLGDYLRTGIPKIIGIGREVIGCRKDGTTFPMGLAVSEVCLKDRRVFTGIVRDLTERRRTEEGLEDLSPQVAQHEGLTVSAALMTRVHEILSTLRRLDALVRDFTRLASERSGVGSRSREASGRPDA
jgi:PAS domain S-box-containing protein